VTDTFDTLMLMTDQPDDVDGLVDARRLAEWLNVPVSRVHTWRSRGLAELPQPTGTLNGPVWRLEDLDGLREALAARPGHRPKGGSKAAAKKGDTTRD
jgi:hypothetical protein